MLLEVLWQRARHAWEHVHRLLEDVALLGGDGPWVQLERVARGAGRLRGVACPIEGGLIGGWLLKNLLRMSLLVFQQLKTPITLSYISALIKFLTDKYDDKMYY